MRTMVCRKLVMRQSYESALVPGDGVRNVRLLESGDLVLTERKLFRCKRVLEVLHLRRADDGRGDARLVQEPREGDLRGGDAARGGHLGRPLDDREVELGLVEAVAEGVGLRAGGQALALACSRAGEEPAGERAPGEHGDALVDALRDHLPLLLAVDEVVV